MGIKNSIKKRYNWLVNVKFDKKTGFYKYSQFEKYIYIRHPRHFLDFKSVKWLCENIYYHYYFPKNNDVVVDLGAGYGEETVYLYDKSPDINFYGIEIQPIIFECLSNTMHGLKGNFKSSSMAIGHDENLFLSSQFSYSSVGDIPENGYIDVPCIKWPDFLKKYNIRSIDLLKMNIEGGEKSLLESISDFSIIKRLVLSCHDFRANDGDGEFYRTKECVINILKKNNYNIKTFSTGKSWGDDWIYAEQNT
jgi:FkbM family methyltransferase